ncbi:MAG: hypothetical protein SH868_12735, partial [Bythopirellula sp.]|nr:hypothetical protein [Bythopirellula sp.]
MKVTVTLLVCLFAVSAKADVFLGFDAPTPGTISDTNGLGTGFTHRLPGTGTALPANDPNMDLLGDPGSLLLTSTRADINQTNVIRNLPILEAPGVLLTNLGSKDIYITALFHDVRVPNSSDQLALYAGVSSEKVLRTSMHPQNLYVFTENFGAGDVNTLSGANSFAPGDDIQLSLNRVSGKWQENVPPLVEKPVPPTFTISRGLLLGVNGLRIEH